MMQVAHTIEWFWKLHFYPFVLRARLDRLGRIDGSLVGVVVIFSITLSPECILFSATCISVFLKTTVRAVAHLGVRGASDGSRHFPRKPDYSFIHFYIRADRRGMYEICRTE